MDKKTKSRDNLLYRLRKKGTKCITKERLVLAPYGDNITQEQRQVQRLCREFGFGIQLEITTEY